MFGWKDKKLNAPPFKFGIAFTLSYDLLSCDLLHAEAKGNCRITSVPQFQFLVKKINATPCVSGVAFTLSNQPNAFNLGVTFVFPSDSYYFDASGESHVEERLLLLHLEPLL